jgi:hypothetical protein
MNLHVSYHSGPWQCPWKKKNEVTKRKEGKEGEEKGRREEKNILSSGMST